MDRGDLVLPAFEIPASRCSSFYAVDPDFIRPETRRNEILRFVEGGLADLSVSRTSFDWGVPVPGSPGHVMYVWVDALTNYLTGQAIPTTRNGWGATGPPISILIGKDIVRFHTVYWPAFLMSAKIALPGRCSGTASCSIAGKMSNRSAASSIRWR